MHLTSSKQKGFSIIELMVVVTIIGILSTMAIPAYSDYVVRSRVVEGLSLAARAKLNVETVYAQGGGMSYSFGYASPQATQNVNSVDIVDQGSARGCVKINYTAKAGGGNLLLAPSVGNDGSGAVALPDPTNGITPLNERMVWKCKASGSTYGLCGSSDPMLDPRFAPAECR